MPTLKLILEIWESTLILFLSLIPLSKKNSEIVWFLKGLFIGCFRCVAVARVIVDRDCLQDYGTKCWFFGVHVNFYILYKIFKKLEQPKEIPAFFYTCVLE